MADLTNDFAWSYSRARAFDGCPRAYWFQYYGSWGGWAVDAPTEARDAYVQKKLTSIPMWVGSVVHRVAEGLLREARLGRTLPALERVAKQVRDDARREVDDSRSGAWLSRPAKRTGFSEHYYAVDTPPAAFDAAVDEVVRQVGVLFGNRIFRRLVVVSSRIRELEEFKQFKVGDVPVWVVLDVMVDDGKGGAAIVDWKTGENHDDGEIAGQLGVYGLYASRVHGVPEGALTALHVNLRHDTVTQHAVGQAEMARAEATVLESAARMRARLVDVAKNVADKADYPTLPEDHRACGRCNFRGVCGRA